MAEVNEVVVNGETIISLANDTATEETVVEGVTFHDASGVQRTGVAVIPTKTSQLINDSEYVVKSDLGGTVEITSGTPTKDNTVLTLNPSGGEVNIYTADEIDLMMSQVSGGVTSIPDEYVTESELETKGYLTSVPSEYITETELTAKRYATQTEVNSLSEEISNYSNVSYGTCSTVAATAEKVVTVDNENWELKVGNIVLIKFDVSNSASNVKLNVNGTGAYPIWYNNAEYTSTGTAYTGYANRVIGYMFNGTHWVWVMQSYDANTTYKNVALGHGYATCTTAEATTAKVGTLASYALTVGGIVAVKFTYGVPANATLNINSKGAKNIFYRGAKIVANIIKAGDIVTFIYDGTQYQLLSIDRWQSDIDSKQPKGNYLTSIPSEYITETELEAKGYATQTVVNELSEEIADFDELLNSGELVGASAYQIAKKNGFVGTEKEWLASLCASNPKVLTKVQYPTEAEAIAYMDSQGDNEAVYVWDNKVYCSASYEITQNTGAFLYKYRASGSSGIVVAEGRSLMVVPVSSFELPLTVDFSPYAISESAYIYGLTTLTANPTTLISNDSFKGRTEPFEVTDLKGCTYLAFAVTTSSKPSSASVKVNGTVIPLTVITDKAQMESAMSSGTVTAHGFTDSGIVFTSNVGQTSSCQQYLDARNTYVFPVPSGYCESKVTYNTNGTHYLNKYNFTTMTGMFTALATANPNYVTEKTLGKDASGTYDIKSYVLDAPTTISSGYASAMNKKKPTFIITSGLHGVEPDAVHEVYHFMKDLCENHMESEHLEYLRNNVRFVIVPISNPWGYVNQSYHNANDVDLNKNFAHGYRTNGTANTGANAYSEAETVLLKGVFDEYKDAIFHLECHGKYGEDTSVAQTIWFSLMRSLNSELIELCADAITKQIGRRAYKLGHNANKSVGGYITYYGTNGRPKDYTGTEYGMLSCTMEGTGKLYGTTGYAIDTQKVNTEALENFILRVLDSLNSRVVI